MDSRRQKRLTSSEWTDIVELAIFFVTAPAVRRMLESFFWGRLSPNYLHPPRTGFSLGNHLISTLHLPPPRPRNLHHSTLPLVESVATASGVTDKERDKYADFGFTAPVSKHCMTWNSRHQITVRALGTHGFRDGAGRTAHPGLGGSSPRTSGRVLRLEPAAGVRAWCAA